MLMELGMAFSKFTNFENGDTVRRPLTTDSGRALEGTYCAKQTLLRCSVFIEVGGTADMR
jgi:hypothetical protein